MVSEPELRAGSGGEWVLYLQQSLNHHYRQQVVDESGLFDDALAGVVRHFQRQRGIEPSGVADATTWLALAETAGFSGSSFTGTGLTDTGLTGTGPDVGWDER